AVPAAAVPAVTTGAAGAAAVGAAGEAVEQAAARPGSGLGDAAEDAGQRVFRACPRVLVGLGGVADLFADRGVPVGGAPRVVAAEDPLVVAVYRPAVELGEPDDRERVRVPLQLQQLQHAVPQVRHRVVLVRLLAERVGVELGQVRAAGQLHQRP